MVLEDSTDVAMKVPKFDSIFPILSFLPSLKIFSAFQWRNHGIHPSNFCAVFYLLSCYALSSLVVAVPRRRIPEKGLLFWLKSRFNLR